MTATVPSLISEFDRSNADLREWTNHVFMNLCAGSDYPWLFFNTLSYMEHIGSYKIMATQRDSVIDYPTLKHLNEETGHAVLFKRHAERLRGSSLDYSADVLLAPASARAYFGRLEAMMVRLFGKRANYRSVYLYMSMIIEFRAVWGYEILQQCIDRNGLQVSLEKLLAEEQGHLYSMVRRLEEDGRFDTGAVNELLAFERTLYVRLLRVLDEQIDDAYPKVA